MKKTENDFLVWTSFPSSGKFISDEVGDWVRWPPLPSLYVTLGSRIKVTLNAKRKGTTPTDRPSHFNLVGYDAEGKSSLPIWPFIRLPEGSFDWKPFSREETLPANIMRIGGQAAGGVGTTWFDDLKIYQDGVLIYADDFSNWSPVIGAGVGAPIGGVAGYLLKEPLGPMVSEAVGAVLGGALGGGIGLLIGLGIIPVPQIPSLEAAPEGPEAPAQLGKYLITG